VRVTGLEPDTHPPSVRTQVRASEELCFEYHLREEEELP
jgi:hypothetical protein